MRYKFHEDFSFCDEADKPYNILIERNSDFEHGHATVKDNEYHILIPGNKHLAQTPPLKDFKLKLKLRIDTPRYEDNCEYFKYGIRLYFRYDRFLKEGYLLECAVSDKAFIANLFAINARNEKKALKETETPVPARFNRSEWNFSIETGDNKFTIGLNGVRVEITDENNAFPGAGQIGLDKCFYHGELIVREWSISSEEKLNKSKVTRPLALELPCVHGMSVPYKYSLNLFKYAHGPYELDIKLSGGIKDRPDRGPCGSQWTHEMDMMKNPYVRIDSPAGEFKNIILFNGLKSLLDREEKRVWVVGRYGNMEWPLNRKIYFDALPDLGGVTFAAGYEFFDHEPKCFMAGGPLEVVADAGGNILYQGASLRRGNVVVSVKSPENKLICARIPENVPDREKALAHARNNHYFYEKEKISFNIKIYYHADQFFAEEIKLSAQVQSVYDDNLGKEVRLAQVPEDDPRAGALKDKLGIKSLCCRAELDETLGTGVYHLAVKILLGDKPLYDENIIFEVMSDLPDAPPPPVASGLPMLFSDNSEVKYLETDAFDPLIERADIMHYFSICHFRPDYARRKRIWELTKLYNRKWYLSITTRTPSDTDLSIENNKDIIAQCDYLQVGFEGQWSGRYDLWKNNAYEDEVLDVLLDFFKHNPEKLKGLQALSLERLEAIKADKKCLPEEALVELVNNCWKEWLAYFSAWFAEMLKRQDAQLKAINKRLGRGSGGPFPVYAAHNKSAYCLNYYGHNPRSGTEKFFDGFWQFEDYPLSCAYSVARALFGLMTIKLVYSSWKLFPEIYCTRCLDGCNDGAVSQAHPPFGFYDCPAVLVRERIYEYAFAAAWFKENKFHFWSDNGFHFSAMHKPANFKELLAAWGNVVKHKPAMPVKTTCFLADWDLIEKHPDYYEKNCNIHASWKDVNNTAEEALAYAYGAARNAGLPAGFVTSLDDLKGLNPDMTDLLVLPPLNKDITKEHIETIRRLHEGGVSLLGFENVHGLEDLFGVKPLEREVKIRKIGVAPEYVAGIGALEDEFAEHDLCKACYANAGASAVLVGAETPEGAMNIPVLLSHKTKWGQTAFFNIPPTVVKRDSFIERIGYGQECLSIVIRQATEYIIRKMSKPCVSVPGAKVIAFHDEKGDMLVVVEEESLAADWDAGKYPRPFLLDIKLLGINSKNISCDRDYSVALEKPGQIVLRLSLGKYESALFKISGVKINSRQD